MATILFLLFLFSFVAGQDSNPLVRVVHGILQGSWKVSTNGRTYASFQGVPYASPPVGKYRFREPQELKPWSGTWDATSPLSECLQYDPAIKTIIGSQNCLFLNVYTPNLNDGANLPVMVFIHGGAFMYGSGDDNAPGNAGLKDQTFALRWVQNNIMVFGGNPESVTLAGLSAGGASVHYHYLSPLSKGTFARGIAFSGSAFASWAHAVKPVQKAKALAAIVGCSTIITEEMVDCLKNRPAEVLVNAQIKMFDWKVHLFTPFTPTVETSGVKKPFLTQYPYLAAQAGAMHRVPLITSVTSEEGLYPAIVYQTDSTILPELEARWEELASNIFEYNDTLPLHLRPAVAVKIKQKYLGGKPVSQETFPQLVQALGDRLFGAEVGRQAQLHALRSGQPVYVYRFAHRGSSSLSVVMGNTTDNFGVSHADDVLQVLKFPGMDFPTTQDKKMIDGLLDMIHSYASTGVPKFPQGPTWQPVTPGAPELNYLEISSPDKMEMKASSDFGHRAFWDSLGFLENENCQVPVRNEQHVGSF
ncbi:hypothetical protein ABMA27_016410 [Loxostege sticticalis]|uniref:Carboxylic ester hydrolase n=1 Tax=Loxostege sticticalis TaxID=481309 RepID=A0ABR3I261_LOXSC